MSLTDPVADFLTRIRNSIRARHQKLDVPASKLKAEIARILKEEGYISNFKTTEENGRAVLRVYLKYGANNEAAIRDLERISRPGCRVYIGRGEIRRVQGGLGISIMTTPKGVMTGRQARREGVGGEVLCEIWWRWPRRAGGPWAQSAAGKEMWPGRWPGIELVSQA